MRPVRMPLHSSLHLTAIAILGREEVSTDQKQDNVGGFQTAIDFCSETAARRNSAIMPRLNHALMFEGRQMLFKLISQM